MDVRKGDIVECLKTGYGFTAGHLYEVTDVGEKDACGFKNSVWAICDSDWAAGQEFWMNADEYAIHATKYIPSPQSKDNPHLHTTPPSRDWQTHPSGALRESKEGKGLPHLLLAGYPRALHALSKHMDCELGRERNWEKGLPESSLVSSGFRHLSGYVSGVSEDSPEYNLVALLWNVMCLVETYLRVQDGVMPEELLDIRKEGEGWDQ